MKTLRVLLLFAVSAMITGIMVFEHDHPVHGMQAQATGWQTGTVLAPVAPSQTVKAWTLVSRAACPSAQDCWTPHVGTTGVSGVALEDGTAGQFIHVIMTGQVECVFSNQPVQNDSAVTNAEMCKDDPRTFAQVTGTEGFLGKVVMTTNPDGTPLVCPTGYSYCAFVNIVYPGATGHSVTAAQFDSTVPAYIQANQSPQVQPDWNASTPPAAIANKPSIPAGQSSITGIRYGNGSAADTVSTSAQLQSTIGTGVYDANGAATTAQGAAQAFATSADTVVAANAANASNLSSGTVAFARLPTLSVTINSQTCTIGSACTITVSSVPASALPAFSGDITTSAGSSVATLAAVGSAGNCGSATTTCALTFDAKGRETARADTPITFPASAVSYFGSAGAISGLKCWVGSVTSTTSGTWTANISSAGITTLIYANAMVKSSGQTAALSSQATLSSTSATSLSGAITVPATVGALGTLSLTLGSSALPVYIEACGT